MKQREDDKDTGYQKFMSGRGLAWNLSKEAQERRRQYLLDHSERLYYEERAKNGDQYV
jgi:hypothetical protein